MAASVGVLLLLPACRPAGDAAGDPARDADRPEPPPGERLVAARDLGRRAVEAYRDGDLERFEALLDSAQVLRPFHPSLLYNRAAARALAGDTAGAVERLSTLAGWGLASDPARDEDFAALTGAPAFEDVRKRLAANGRPGGTARRAFELEGPETLPEGLAYDPRTGDLALASVRHRQVLKIAPDGSTTVLLDGAHDGLPSPLGLAIDPDRRALWVSGTPVPESAPSPDGGGTAADAAGTADTRRGEVREYDFDTGRLRRSLALPASRDAGAGTTDGLAAGDVAVLPSGEVLVSDWRTGALLRSDAGSDTLRVVLPPGTLGSPQGVVPTADGRGAWVADYGLGLVYVDFVGRTAHVLEAPTTLLGSDALLADGDRLVVVQNGVSPDRVLRLTPSTDRSRVTDVEVLLAAHPDFAGPTGATWAGGRLLLVANGQWSHFAGGRVSDAGSLRGPIVLEVETP